MTDREPGREEWRPVPGHPDYEVSSLGRVRSWKKSRIKGVAQMLQTGPDSQGYLRTTLDKKLYRVHQVVALAWHGPCPEGMEVGHLNSKRSDNRPENLSYVTRQENLAEMLRRPPRTHCKRGHPLSGDNLYITPSNGQRICRTCRRRRMTKRHLDDCDYCGRPLPNGLKIQGDETIYADDKPVRSEFSNEELRKEVWRGIAAHPDYEVSNLGRVRSYKRCRGGRGGSKPLVLTPQRDYSGYERVSLDSQHRSVHQLVAEAFFGPRPDGYEVAHTNHIRNDNRAANLRYATRQENLRERFKERSTHCKRGHPLSGDNLYIVPHNGRRVCRICLRPRLRNRNLHDCPRCGRDLPETLKPLRVRDS